MLSIPSHDQAVLTVDNVEDIMDILRDTVSQSNNTEDQSLEGLETIERLFDEIVAANGTTATLVNEVVSTHRIRFIAEIDIIVCTP